MGSSRDGDSNSKCDFESEFEFEPTKCNGNFLFEYEFEYELEGCVTVCVHGACVDMYDHIVVLVVYHPSSCRLCNHKRTNRIHYFRITGDESCLTTGSQR